MYNKRESFIRDNIYLSEDCLKILQRLYNQRRIGGSHIPETICRGWIKHLPKNEYKEALRDVELWIKEGIILTKPKPSDRHLFLNPHELQNIKQIITEEETNHETL